MRRSSSRVAVLVAGALTAGLALGGCAITTTDTSPTPVDPNNTQTPLPVIDLQLRPVVSVAPAAAGQCSPTPAPTPPARGTATVCSADRRLSYSLGAAAVSGEHVTSVEGIYAGRSPVVQVKVDAMGGAALLRMTLEGSIRRPQAQLAIVTHGTVLAAPTMTEEIDGGVLLVTGFDSLERAQRTAAYVEAAGG